MALCVTCVFSVTLSVFPAITGLVKPNGLFTGTLGRSTQTHSFPAAKEETRIKREFDFSFRFSPSADIFTPLCCFMVFNVMDWIGRSATSIFQWVRFRDIFFSDKNIWAFKAMHTFCIQLYFNIHHSCQRQLV